MLIEPIYRKTPFSENFDRIQWAESPEGKGFTVILMTLETDTK